MREKIVVAGLLAPFLAAGAVKAQTAPVGAANLPRETPRLVCFQVFS
jgi:hypothetical protein